MNSGSVIGGGPGIVREDRLTDDEAFYYIDLLQKDRKYADYGYSSVPEPYDAAKADQRLTWANRIIEDLQTLL